MSTSRHSAGIDRQAQVLRPKTLIFVRHGHYPGNDAGRPHDHQTRGLSELGRQQAEAVRDWMRAEGLLDRIDEAVTSPLHRAVETAEIVGFPNARREPRLVERHRGAANNMPTAEFERRYPQSAVFKRRTPVTWIPPGPDGESEVMVARKVRQVLPDLTGDCVVAFVHGELMWATRHLFIGLTDAQSAEARQDPDHTLDIHNATVDEYANVHPRSREVVDAYRWMRTVTPALGKDSGWIEIEDPIPIAVHEPIHALGLGR